MELTEYRDQAVTVAILALTVRVLGFRALAAIRVIREEVATVVLMDNRDTADFRGRAEKVDGQGFPAEADFRDTVESVQADSQVILVQMSVDIAVFRGLSAQAAFPVIRASAQVAIRAILGLMVRVSVCREFRDTVVILVLMARKVNKAIRGQADTAEAELRDTVVGAVGRVPVVEADIRVL